jgi:hypothetical protein
LAISRQPPRAAQVRTLIDPTDREQCQGQVLNEDHLTCSAPISSHRESCCRGILDCREGGVRLSQISWRTTVAHQSTEDTGKKLPGWEQFLYVFKAAQPGRTRRRSGAWPPLPLSLGGDQAHADRLARIARSPRGAKAGTAPRASERGGPAAGRRPAGSAAWLPRGAAPERKVSTAVVGLICLRRALQPGMTKIRVRVAAGPPPPIRSLVCRTLHSV